MTNLGKIAMINGRFKETNKCMLSDFLETTPLTLELEQTYYDHSQLKELAAQNIETIIISEPFAFQDKIFDIYEALIQISKDTGWKPKRLINSMEYGKEGLFLMCEKVGIDFCQLNYNFGDDFERREFAITKINLTDREFSLAKIQFGYLFHD